MIRRSEGTETVLITQVDHAGYSGILASRIGNSEFARLEPDVISAIAAHDGGWPIHDANPILDDKGLPLHVFETPVLLTTRIWTASVEQAAPLGGYAQLLVSIHQLNLSNIAMMHHRGTPHEMFELNKFQHKQIEIEDALRKHLGLRTDIPVRLGVAVPGTNEAEDKLRFDFQMLTLCDRLSLQLCCGKMLFGKIEQMSAAPGGPLIDFEIDMPDESTCIVRPWPFDAEVLEAEVPCRRLSPGAFASETAFTEAYREAERDVIAFKVRRN